jgi:ATP-binding cassette subfamily B (MDR/TAP) protein 1
VSWYRVASYNSPEVLYAVLGVLSCVVTGVTMPAFSILLSRFISLYYDPNPDSLWASALFYMGMFILIGGANLVFCCSQQWAFGVLGERLVRRARSAAFASLLRFETAWHDAHPPGAVTSLLGASAYLLRSATGAQLALAVQNVIGLLAGLVIAFTASWQITLVVLCLAPFLALGGMLALRYATRSMEESTKAFEASGAVATEALSAPRTVAAYGLQAASQAAYSAALDAPTAANLASAAMSGLGMGTMTFMMLLVSVWEGSRQPAHTQHFCAQTHNTHTFLPPTAPSRRPMLSSLVWALSSSTWGS